MGKKKNAFLGNIHPAVISVWAAILAASHLIPGFPMLGTGGNFSVSSALIPLAGIFFGPIPGALCAAIGNFIGYLIAPSGAWLGMATFLIGTVNALAAGLVSRGKWPYAAGLIAIGTILWFSNPIGQSVPLFAIVFYGLGLIAVILGGLVSRKGLIGKNAFLKAVAIFLCAFAGLVTAASLANFASLTLLELPATIWTALVFVSPFERAMFSLGAVIIGIPLLVGLPKIGIFVGPEDPNDIVDDDVIEKVE
ncbi:MAG: ECF transporter S component [Bacillota bacterium]